MSTPDRQAMFFIAMQDIMLINGVLINIFGRLPGLRDKVSLDAALMLPQLA